MKGIHLQRHSIYFTSGSRPPSDSNSDEPAHSRPTITSSLSTNAVGGDGPNSKPPFLRASELERKAKALSGSSETTTTTMTTTLSTNSSNKRRRTTMAINSRDSTPNNNANNLDPSLAQMTDLSRYSVDYSLPITTSQGRQLYGDRISARMLTCVIEGVLASGLALF